MNLEEFIQKYDGEPVDFDHNGYYWCVDLARAYCDEVLGIVLSPPVEGAADIWDSFNKNDFNRIYNTPLGIPETGDIIIWSSSVGGGSGHIAIFLEGTANSFTSFDQNWPTGTVCHKQNHRYNNVLGWLHPQGGLMPSDDGALKELQSQYDKLSAEFALEQQRVVDCRADRTTQEQEIKNLKEEMNKQRDDMNVRITAAETGQKAEKQARQEILQWLSTNLNTTQNWPEIQKAIVGLIGVEDLLNKERRAHSDTKGALDDANKQVKALEAEIERLEGELKKAKGITDASSIELLIEVYERIIARLKSIIRR